MGTAVLTASFTNDAAGRQTRQIDYMPGGSVGYDRQVTFNAAGQVSGETVATRQGNDTLTSIVTNQYGTGTGYGLGAMVSSATSETRVSGGTTTTSASATTNSLAWWDGAVTASSSAATTPTGGTTTTIVTSYSYGADGSLQSVGVGGTAPYNVTFANDLNGQVIRRDKGALGTTGPHELWYLSRPKTLIPSEFAGTVVEAAEDRLRDDPSATLGAGLAPPPGSPQPAMAADQQAGQVEATARRRQRSKTAEQGAPQLEGKSPAARKNLRERNGRILQSGAAACGDGLRRSDIAHSAGEETKVEL
jgi:hypothetical protein